MKMKFLCIGILSISTSIISTGADECKNQIKKVGISAENAPVGTTQWGTYTCNHCQQKTRANPGTHGEVNCSHCGAAHSNEKYVYEDTITSENLANTAASHTHAKSGRKWVCSHCNHSNFKSQPTCDSCGAPEASKAILKPEVVPALRTRRSMKPWLIGGGTAATLGAVAWMTFSTKQYPAAVTSMAWKHITYLDRFSLTTKSDWKDEIRQHNPVMPQNGAGEIAGAFNIRNIRPEHHHNIQVPDGMETYYETVYDSVPYQDTEWQDNGNGSRTMVSVTRYRSVPRQERRERMKYRSQAVYEDKADYDTYVWSSINSAVLSGAKPQDELVNGRLPWQHLPLGPHDRERLEASYQVNFAYSMKNGDKSSYVIRPSSESEFFSWKPGDTLNLHINKFGKVMKTERPPQ